jgi:putative FmdB family regulatory protein
MPTYEYRCNACKHEFEEFQSITAPHIKKCPSCGKLKLERLIGIGSAVMFKGGGFYETDYRSESYKQAAKADADAAKPKTDSSESKAASPTPKPTRNQTANRTRRTTRSQNPRPNQRSPTPSPRSPARRATDHARPRPRHRPRRNRPHRTHAGRPPRPLPAPLLHSHRDRRRWRRPATGLNTSPPASPPRKPHSRPWAPAGPRAWGGPTSPWCVWRPVRRSCASRAVRRRSPGGGESPVGTSR